MWDFEAVSLNPSAIWDENRIYPRIETRYTFTPNMNKKVVKKFNTGNFTKESANLKIKCYDPKNLILQHLPFKERGKRIEFFRMRSRYISDTLTSVDTQEIVKIGGEVIEIYEGVIYREYFEVSI